MRHHIIWEHRCAVRYSVEEVESHNLRSTVAEPLRSAGWKIFTSREEPVDNETAADKRKRIVAEPFFIGRRGERRRTIRDGVPKQSEAKEAARSSAIESISATLSARRR